MYTQIASLAFWPNTESPPSCQILGPRNYEVIDTYEGLRFGKHFLYGSCLVSALTVPWFFKLHSHSPSQESSSYTCAGILSSSALTSVVVCLPLLWIQARYLHGLPMNLPSQRWSHA